MDEVILRPFRADDAPWIVERHGVLYARDEGFDDTFPILVGRILDDFVAGHDPDCERGWLAESDGARLGCIFCVRETRTTAKLRMFLLEPAARGRGLGRRLLQTCTGFARRAGYARMVLWTHESHRAACALYAAAGWSLVDSKPAQSFGVDVVEQHWQITL